MNQELTDDEIFKIYSKAMNLRLINKFLAYYINLVLGFWMLWAIFFQDLIPVWFAFSLMLIGIPNLYFFPFKHFRVIEKDERLRKKFYISFLRDRFHFHHPFLYNKFYYTVIRPTKEDSNYYHWILILYYFSFSGL